MKSSRLPTEPYDGFTCIEAGVPVGKWYDNQQQAIEDAAKLSQYNPVGFLVYSLDELVTDEGDVDPNWDKDIDWSKDISWEEHLAIAEQRVRDEHIEKAPDRPSGTIDVKLEYQGKSVPAPLDKPQD